LAINSSAALFYFLPRTLTVGSYGAIVVFALAMGVHIGDAGDSLSDGFSHGRAP
jgi:hypothetical protein